MSLVNYLLQNMDTGNIDFQDLWNDAFAEGRDSIDIDQEKSDSYDQGYEDGKSDGYDEGYGDAEKDSSDSYDEGYQDAKNELGDE